MKRLLALVLLVPLLAATAARGDDLAPGTWKIATLSGNGAVEITPWVLKLENAGGKTTATLASGHPNFRQPQLKSFTIKGETVHAVLFNGFNESIFEGKLAGKDGKKVVGTLGTDEFPNPAWMVPTDVTKLDKTNWQTPAGDAGAGIAALFKVRIAKKGANEEDVARWAETATKDAVQFGPAWQATVHGMLANALVKYPGQAAAALRYAELAEKALPAKASPARQIGALETLARAQQANGKGEHAKAIMNKVANLDRILDKEYIATGLPFKPAPFAGRKADSKRAVVLELFTGAQCPPCVAADMAFDGLVKAYKSTDLVLIQYHEHIPGPDPLTNGDSEARWRHYQEAFASTGKKIGGVPTAIINGKTVRGGGGPLAFSEKTFDAYRDMLDPILETPAGCTIKATAKRVGDKIEIHAEVAGLEKAGPDKKLRLLLLEEAVHYGGGNKIRIHHHVVRAMPGGADGKAITDKNLKTTASVNVPELRKNLNSYLDTFVADKGPFPRQIRPMEMQHLRVVALVQDDATNEILNAVQVNVEP